MLSRPEIGLQYICRQMDRQTITKEAIIAEYLAGGITYRKLSAKYGVDFRTIHQWVQKFQGKERLKKPSGKKVSAVVMAAEPPLPADVKQLQKELRKAQLHNKLLNAIIDIAEEQLHISIRKKSGSRQ